MCVQSASGSWINSKANNYCHHMSRSQGGPVSVKAILGERNRIVGAAATRHESFLAFAVTQWPRCKNSRDARGCSNSSQRQNSRRCQQATKEMMICFTWKIRIQKPWAFSQDFHGPIPWVQMEIAFSKQLELQHFHQRWRCLANIELLLRLQTLVRGRHGRHGRSVGKRGPQISPRNGKVQKMGLTIYTFRNGV